MTRRVQAALVPASLYDAECVTAFLDIQAAVVEVAAAITH